MNDLADSVAAKFAFVLDSNAPNFEPTYSAAMLSDPNFCLAMLNQPDMGSLRKAEEKELKLLLHNVDRPEIAQAEHQENPAVEPPPKYSRLFSGIQLTAQNAATEEVTGAAELKSYLQNAISYFNEKKNELQFWQANTKLYPRLAMVALNILAVPATSAPVERVFFPLWLVLF